MKYFKSVFVLFLIVTTLSAFDVRADFYTGRITIPNRNQIWYSGPVKKGLPKVETQTIMSTMSYDNLSGDERAVKARLQGTIFGLGQTAWENTIIGVHVPFESKSQALGMWCLELYATKWLLTSSTFNGHWHLE